MPRGEQRPAIVLGPDNAGTPAAKRQMRAEVKRIDDDLVRGRSDAQVDRNLEVYNTRVRHMKQRLAAKEQGEWQKKRSWTVDANGKISEVDI